MMRVLTATALALSLSCGPSRAKDSDPKDDESTQEKNHDSDEPEATPPASNPAAGLGMLGSMLSASADKPGLYDPPKQSDNYTDDIAHTVIVDLSGAVVELQALSLWGGSLGTELGKITERLHSWAADEHVTGLLVRVGPLQLSMATAQELRLLLSDFKSRGGRTRKVFCHIENATTLAAYILSACDNIGLAPGGLVEMAGFAAIPLHFKGLLDKLKIKADFLHVGAYKGAAEPLTLDKPSPQMNETIDAVLDTFYAALVGAMKEGRGISKEELAKHVSQGFFFDQEALSAKLVDEIATFEAYRDKQLGDGAWKKKTVGADIKEELGDFMSMLGLAPKTRSSKDHVALVYAVGGVIDGPGRGLIGAREEIASRPLANALRTLARADSVKAVVLRISSGGGSALASEIIWQSVSELQKKKPVVVSMGTVAASGGYYIGCGASKIFALETTLTGSIGVVGGKMALGESLEEIGIKAFPRRRGDMATAFLPFDTWTPAERERMRAILTGVYRQFTSRVSAGRNMKPEDLEQIAQGRVWTGAAAKNNGLVDELGGLQAALAHARDLAKVDSETPLEVYPPAPTLMDIVRDFAGTRAPSWVDSQPLSDLLLRVSSALSTRLAGAVSAHLTRLLSFAQEPIQTVMWLPAALP